MLGRLHNCVFSANSWEKRISFLSLSISNTVQVANSQGQVALQIRIGPCLRTGGSSRSFSTGIKSDFFHSIPEWPAMSGLTIGLSRPVTGPPTAKAFL